MSNKYKTRRETKKITKFDLVHKGFAKTIGKLLKLQFENCNGKLDCLICEMLFVKKKKPSLDTQSDSVRANYLVDILTTHTHLITRQICYLLFTFLTPHPVYINSFIFYFLT